MFSGKKTRQKQLIYEELKCMDHPSATELYEVIHEKYPSLSRATVFRVLSNFSKDGYIRKLEFADSEVRYDWNNDGHQHCRCRVCGKIGDCKVPFAESLTDNSLFPKGFIPEGVEIEFKGICSDCAKSVIN